MKRAISMLVAIVMVLSLVPTAFAASEDAVVLEDISTIAVTLNADNGYFATYSWTPADNGELSLYQYTEKEIEMIVTQGENSATSYSEEGVYGFAVSLDVLAGEEVTIEVFNAVEEEETFEISGNFTKKAGMDQNNPIYLNALENVVDNKGTQWYAGFFSGTNLIVNGPEGFTVTYNGEVTEDWWGDVTISVSSPNPRMPVVFAITGDGQYSVNFVYPEGSSMNPAVLSTEMANYSYIEAGTQGYFYTWTAPAAGTLTVELYAEDADWNPLGWSYQINNLTTYAYGDTQWSDSDPVVNPAELTVAEGDELQIVVTTYDPANPWSAPAGDLYVTATFVCQTHGATADVDNNDGTHNTVCQACGTVFSTAEHTFTEGVCTCGAEQDGTETNPRDLTNDLLYEGDFTAVVTVPANTTFYCMAYRVNGMVMTINGGEGVTCTTDGMMMPYTWTLVNDSAEEAEYVIVVAAPVGSQDNPAVLSTEMSNYAGITAGAQGYFFTWTAPAAGTLSLSFYAEDADWNELGWTYAVNNMTSYAYGDTQWSDSDPVVNPYELTVAAGDEIQIMANTYDPTNPWNAPAGDLYVTAAFVCAEHGETQNEDNYDGTHNVKCLACGTTLATEAHTFVEGVCNCGATMPGTAENPHDLTSDLLYDGDFTATITVPANTTYYCMAYRVNGMVMTINGGAGVTCTTNGMMMPYTWTIVNDSTEAAEYVIVVAAPVGTMDNPEVLFRPGYINVNIAEGNNQGYFYKWTSNAEGTLKLTCPTVDGVVYDVNMINKSTYQQVWLQDSTDGTISLDVKYGDEVIIQVAVMPDDAWNIPALQTALTGEFVFPVGSAMNPEALKELSWYYGTAIQAQGNVEGYYYTYTAPATGLTTFYFGYNEGLENYVLDIMVTNMNTYAQMSLLQDGVDNYGMELQVPVKEGEELLIQVVAIQDAEGNYNPAAEMVWCGNFAYPAGTEQNPINIEWNWNEEYSAATASVTVEAGATVYYSGNAGMILTVNGVETAMNAEGVFAITNETEAAATYELALATPVGAYNNPAVIEVLPYTNSQSLAADSNYNYLWTATEDATVVLTATEGVNITADLLTYVEDSEWPITEQFELATPTIDENWNYTGWDVAEKLTIEVKAGQQLKIQVTGLTDWSDWSTPAVDYTLNIQAEVKEAAAIIAQPQNVTANSGETVQFKVETTGEVVSYKWQYKKLHVWFDTAMTGYNTDTLTVAATGARNNYAYRCVVTFADGTKVISDAAVMTVNTVINILDNPNDQVVALGYKGQFTVLAEGESLKYQWQYQRPDGERWIDTEMEGSNKPTVYIETTAARDGYKYRCMITDAAGAVSYSEVATMTVLYYTTQPADVRTEEGKTVTFSVETNAAVVRYEWQYRKTETGKWMPTSMAGYNTATLTVTATAARDGYQYRCVVTGAKSSKVESKVATLNIGSAAEITAQPESVTAAAGAKVSFSVEATNVLSYKWQYTKNGTLWYGTSMEGADTATLTVDVTAGRNGYQYRCQITGTDGEVIYTNAATLTVK